MSIADIEARAAAEARVHAVAKQIRELLDGAADVELSDGRDPEETILELVTGE